MRARVRAKTKQEWERSRLTAQTRTYNQDNNNVVVFQTQ